MVNKESDKAESREVPTHEANNPLVHSRITFLKGDLKVVGYIDNIFGGKTKVYRSEDGEEFVSLNDHLVLLCYIYSLEQQIDYM